MTSPLQHAILKEDIHLDSFEDGLGITNKLDISKAVRRNTFGETREANFFHRKTKWLANIKIK